MAKNKRKVYSTQRDKSVIDTAKYLKRIGALSPQAKLHGGKFVSRGVLKRVRQLEPLAAAHYTTRKAPKEVIEKAKAKGFMVVRGNRIVGPSGDRRFFESIKRGEPAGVVPVRQGFMEVVPLPLDYFELVRALRDTKTFNQLKRPNEFFTFRFFGNQGRYAFADTERLLIEIERYLPKLKKYYDREGVIFKDDVEEPEGLEITRLHPVDIGPLIENAPHRKKKREKNRASRKHKNQSRADMHPARANRLRQADAARHRERFAKMTEKQREAYNEKQREKMRAYRKRLKDEGNS